MKNKFIIAYLKLKFILGKFLIKKSSKFQKLGSFLITNVLTRQLVENIELDLGLSIINIEKNIRSKSSYILLYNPLLLEAEDFLPSIFYIIRTDPKIKNFNNNIVIFCTAIAEHVEFPLHTNFLIEPKTTILDYYNHYINYLKYLKKENYNTKEIKFIKVKIWKVDHFKSKNIYLH